jgi:hypothetical protein
LLAATAVLAAAAGCSAAPGDRAVGETGERIAVGAVFNFGTLAHPGSCMDSQGGGTADGTRIQEYACNGTKAQAFELESAGNGEYTLLNTNANKCVDVAARGTANGTKIQLWDCNQSPAQTFWLEPQANGFVTIVNTNSGKCLDVAGDNPANGTIVQLYDCNGTNAQLWNPTAIAASPGGSGSSSGSTTPPGGGSSGSGTPPSNGGACKRGVAAGSTPSAALAPTSTTPGVSWWYDWGSGPSGSAPGLEFVPMIWGRSGLNDSLPAGAKYVLGFNEPNFTSQANMTPAQAAAAWPTVQAKAKAAGIPLVSPAVNFCGSASNPSQCSDQSVTDPYTYLSDFLAACPGCEVDYVAVHWYNCDLPSLQAYIEGNTSSGGSLPGFVQFGKPIWLTEFSCDGGHSAADQKAYMQAAIPWLESNAHVFRYSWFSASPIPSALLTNQDGSLTDLGATYVSLPESCR